MDDKKDLKEFTNDILMADIMLRLTAIEKLLLEKQAFSQEELTLTTEEIAKKVSKIVLEKANASKSVQDLILGLETDSKNNLKN